tara:strand:+ start:1888 stop:2766 length:879 start_codon:yes stop_codon:yes gene_type:complete
MKKHLFKNQGILLYCETFGEKTDVPILLIAGNASQGISWRKDFCQKLVNAGYYVIHYDHRDTGLSSKVDFHETPYTLTELTNDALFILESLGMKKTHIMGLSMGGYIGQLLAIHHSNKVLSLTCLMTSPFSLSLHDAFMEEKVSKLPIGFINDSFKETLIHLGPTPESREGKRNHLLAIWEAYNGEALPFDYKAYKKIADEWIERDTNPQILNHSLAVGDSLFDRRDLLKKVETPTLIIHGNKDPFFPPEHGLCLKETIPNAHYLSIDNMGHLLHQAFDDTILSAFFTFKPS